MFEDILGKYKYKGSFTYTVGERFEDKCNAPTDGGGIYLIYEVKNSAEKLLYFGASGQRKPDGTFKVRKRGMYDRLINGYHPNQFSLDVEKNRGKRIKRKKHFPLIMEKFGIKMIKIYWYITYKDEYADFPTDIERKIRSKYQLSFPGKLPSWHKCN